MTSEEIFTQAMGEWIELARKGLDETAAAMAAFNRALDNAPEWFMSAAREEAEKVGLIPPADGYDEEGKPVYRLSSVMEHLGIDAVDIDPDTLKGMTVTSTEVNRIN
jgi:hypothetical protein